MRVENLQADTTITENGERVYSPHNKPSAHDVGAITQADGDARFAKIVDVWAKAATYSKSEADSKFLGKTAKAVDSDKLGGIEAAYNLENKTGSIVIKPKGGEYRTTTTAITGGFKIKLPKFRPATMLTIKVRVYQYTTGKSFDCLIAGYAYTDPNTPWYNCSAYMAGGTDEIPVRYCANNTEQYIVLGDTNYTWQYPQVTITDVTMSHSNLEASKWDKDWSITTITSIPSGEEKIKIIMGRQYTSQHKPTAADVGALTQSTADGRYLGKTAKAASATIADKASTVSDTNLGYSGSTYLTIPNSNWWGDKGVGHSQMVKSNSVGLPTASAAYVFKVGARDVARGHGWLCLDNYDGGGNLWYGANQDGTKSPSWAKVYSTRNKPSWNDIQGTPSISWNNINTIPATASRWPTWNEVTGKPSTMAPSSHTHPWSQITGAPVYTQRWPSWSEITSKPSDLLGQGTADGRYAKKGGDATVDFRAKTLYIGNPSSDFAYLNVSTSGSETNLDTVVGDDHSGNDKIRWVHKGYESGNTYRVLGEIYQNANSATGAILDIKGIIRESGNDVYTTARKPSASDIGAVSKASKSIPDNTNLFEYFKTASAGFYSSGSAIANKPSGFGYMDYIVLDHGGGYRSVICINQDGRTASLYINPTGNTGWTINYSSRFKPTYADLGTMGKYQKSSGSAKSFRDPGSYRIDPGVTDRPFSDYSQMLVVHGGGDTAMQIAGNYDSSRLYWRGFNFTSAGGQWNRVYTDRDKPTPADIGALGASSKAVDSAKLNGVSNSTSASANTIAQRDGAGDVNGRLFRSTYQNDTYCSGAIAFRTNNGSDNYTRYCSSPTAVRDWVSDFVERVGFISSTGTPSWHKLFEFNASQIGAIVSFDIVGSSGYNQGSNQLFRLFGSVHTGNGTPANGIDGSFVLNGTGDFANNGVQMRVVPTNNTHFVVYAYLPAYAGSGSYVLARTHKASGVSGLTAHSNSQSTPSGGITMKKQTPYTISSAGPSGGYDGDVWLQYE